MWRLWDGAPVVVAPCTRVFHALVLSAIPESFAVVKMSKVTQLIWNDCFVALNSMLQRFPLEEKNLRI
ncbi:hypothetical protein Pelo_17931 [Pelomyxa schiedti]|nr:hypothetical protein Pelo_17931 [Pelomyxa schiedti]